MVGPWDVFCLFPWPPISNKRAEGLETSVLSGIPNNKSVSTARKCRDEFEFESEQEFREWVKVQMGREYPGEEWIRSGSTGEIYMTQGWKPQTSSVDPIQSIMEMMDPGTRPVNFQRAMAFVDGTNLFHRLEAARLKLNSLIGLCQFYCGGRQLIRSYLYTSRPHYDRAKDRHGETALEEQIRVVFGNAVPTGDGNYKEKGVDALLVADLIYHAAAKNFEYAVLISTDADFALALKRVEDFGCRTAVVSIGAHAPNLLRQAADDVFDLDADVLVQNKWAINT